PTKQKLADNGRKLRVPATGSRTILCCRVFEPTRWANSRGAALPPHQRAFNHHICRGALAGTESSGELLSRARQKISSKSDHALCSLQGQAGGSQRGLAGIVEMGRNPSRRQSLARGL